jgi:dihydroorotate dehydrogenase
MRKWRDDVRWSTEDSKPDIIEIFPILEDVLNAQNLISQEKDEYFYNEEKMDKYAIKIAYCFSKNGLSKKDIEEYTSTKEGVEKLLSYLKSSNLEGPFAKYLNNLQNNFGIWLKFRRILFEHLWT